MFIDFDKQRHTDSLPEEITEAAHCSAEYLLMSIEYLINDREIRRKRLKIGQFGECLVI